MVDLSGNTSTRKPEARVKLLELQKCMEPPKKKASGVARLESMTWKLTELVVGSVRTVTMNGLDDE
jgi:hypothetical protein